MGILQKMSQVLGLNRDLNLEEYMDAVEVEEVDLLHEGADFYVLPMALETEADVNVVQEELQKKNLILLNITPLKDKKQRLQTAVNGLKDFVTSINGDIARIDEDKILLTPEKVKIIKQRKK